MGPGAAAAGAVLIGAGLLLTVMAWRERRPRRARALAQLLDLPGGEDHRPDEADAHSPLVEGTVALAGRVVERLDTAGALARSLERARVPLRPGEYVVIVLAAGVSLGVLFRLLTGQWAAGATAAALTAVGAVVLLRQRIARRRKRFEAQLPGALSLVASSLAAGHTFLRAIQMMCEESDPPLAEEFARMVSETRLGYSVVDALERMAARLAIRDLDWIVQAIRIQQTVGGRLAELLHTLADFIRDRDEVRREVSVLTAEGRISAYVLGALAPFLLLAIQVMNPEYMSPMYRGWGLVVLIGSGFSVVFGTAFIFRMVKIEV